MIAERQCTGGIHEKEALRRKEMGEAMEFKPVGDDAPTITPAYLGCKHRLILRTLIMKISFFVSDEHESGWKGILEDDPEMQYA
ncbi:hypothetical protein HID58_055622 [Brassica napus]|uniref:Uncharacterized protein n=1 Tax=Brassica napus TaxID=3708 RepID=A0ABQ8AL44_BRANA|nr:hypothetical protein HID58_055622 [Brassica napus]